MTWRRITVLIAAGAISSLWGTTAEAESVPFLQCSAPAQHTSTQAPHNQANPLCTLLPAIRSGECARQLLDDLKSRDPLLARGPSQIVVIEQQQVNAYLIDPVRIGITRGMLDHASRRSDMEFVLAHELGHYVLNTISGNSPHRLQSGREQERLADQYASWLTGFHRVNHQDLLAMSTDERAPVNTPDHLRLALSPEKFRDLRY